MSKAFLKNAIKPVILPSLKRFSGYFRRRKLRTELPHITQQSLVQDLNKLNLPPQAMVLVHTSLKRIGYVEGGAETVISAMQDVVVKSLGGTLVLPTFSIDGTMHKTLSSGRVFDVRSTPSNLGAIPEAFRRLPNVKRSIHPTHSFAAIGKEDAWLVSDHHFAGTNFGKNTPMARMLEYGGYLMGIGTHLGTVTFYHCLEDLLEDFPIKIYSSDSPFHVECIDWYGKTYQLNLPAHGSEPAKTRIDRPESTKLREYFTSCFERNAELRWFEIGGTKGWILPMDKMYAECLRQLEKGITIYSSSEELEVKIGSITYL